MTNSTPRLPILTLVLIVANLAAAFLLLWQPQLVDQFGFKPGHPSAFDAVLSLFLHQNVLHLLGNMLFLAAVGASVELATGSMRFLTVYFVSGLVGVLLHYLVFRQIPDAPPLIGASGSISGCAGYYALRYNQLRVPMGPRLSASILTVSLIWFALQIGGAFFRLGDPGAAPAFWAHLGGFCTGALLSFLFRAPDLGQEHLDREVLDRVENRSPATLANTLRAHLVRHPRDLTALRRLAEALETLGDHDELVGVELRILDLAPAEERMDIIRRLCELAAASRIPFSSRVRLAPELASTDVTTALALYDSLAQDGDSDQQAEALFCVAELCHETDRARAIQAVKALAERFPSHPAATRAKARGLAS